MATLGPVEERTSRLYRTTLKDEADVVFNGSAFTSLTLTYYDLDTDTIINARNAQNVLNLNGVTISALGVLEWLLSDLDTAMVTVTQPYELHRALFTGLWNPGGGVRTWRHEVTILIRNILMVP